MVQNSAPSIPEGGKARDVAGKAVGVSGFTLDCATKVLEKGEPEGDAPAVLKFPTVA